MATLDLVNVQKSFGSVKVLHDISIGMAHGEFLVLVGPSGCGKSTLMNIIAGLEEPTGGNLRLAGRDITQLAPADRNISMVFQSYALYPNMTVAKNIEFPLEMRKVEKAKRAERVQSVAKLLQIEHLLERKPRQLSGGQRQRVAIGRALAREPQLYLFDEPLSNLDAQLRLDMRTEIKKLHQRLGATIVYVTHDQIEAMTLATRIAVMKGGVLQQLGTPYEVYNRPANTFVAAFMGSPPMNLLPGSVRHGVLHVGEAPLATVHAPDGPATVGIRPEHLLVCPPSVHGTVPAQVDFCEPLGSHVLVNALVEASDNAPTSVVVQAPPDTVLDVGTSVALKFNPEKTYLFDAVTGSARVTRERISLA